MLQIGTPWIQSASELFPTHTTLNGTNHPSYHLKTEVSIMLCLISHVQPIMNQ